MAGPAVEVHDLVIRYGKKVAVDRINFEASAGQVVTLLGPNGAGKTSTIEALEGYRRPTLGKVRVLGLDPQRDRRALSRRIGVMLQRGGVYPGMTPREAVALFAQYYDESDEPDGLLYRVGLTSVAKTPWRRLSGGEQQRLALALALVGRPWVAFLDEPTAGVDPQGRLTIREVITDLRAAGTCVLLTTHELGEAERLADRILIIDQGRIVAEGSPSELMTREAGKEIRFGAPAGVDTHALSSALGVVVLEPTPGEYVVQAEARPATVARLTAWLAERDLPLSDLRAGRQRLEDVFLRLTSGTDGNGGGDRQARSESSPVTEDGTAAAAAAPLSQGRRRRVPPTGRGPAATEPPASASAAAPSSAGAGPAAASAAAPSSAVAGPAGADPSVESDADRASAHDAGEGRS